MAQCRAPAAFGTLCSFLFWSNASCYSANAVKNRAGIAARRSNKAGDLVKRALTISNCLDLTSRGFLKQAYLRREFHYQILLSSRLAAAENGQKQPLIGGERVGGREVQICLQRFCKFSFKSVLTVPNHGHIRRTSSGAEMHRIDAARTSGVMLEVCSTKKRFERHLALRQEVSCAVFVGVA